MLRTLRHYWPIHLAVASGAAVAAAVLAGALLVGDSVRGSLRDLTLERLGRVESALVADRFFREELAELWSGAAPAVVLRGSASNPGSGAVASGLAILGVDRRFEALYGPGGELDLDREAGQMFPPLVLNESARRELGIEIGEAIVLRFGSASRIPRESLMGETDPEAVLASIRLTLRQVVPDRGVGRFGLAASQQTPLNAFVGLETMQRALDLRGRVNAVFVDASDPDPNGTLDRGLLVEDLGLTLRRRDGFIELGSEEFVLRPAVDRAIGQVAESIGAPLQRTQSYLANRLRAGERRTPYALVAALDPRPDLPWAALVGVGGARLEAPGAEGILLNTWTARDLQVEVGDRVEMTYFAVGPRERLREESIEMRVDGIVAIEGLGADSTLTPDYPGIHDARDLSAWDPPFPVDLGLIRPVDEQYWDELGATPKAFVSEQTGRHLWATRFGSTTAVRVGASAGRDLIALEAELRRHLRERLSSEAAGLFFVPVKRRGLEAATGATDFAQLFVAFSFFLILSAAMLVGLLFRLGVEQRAAEVGLLLAVGYRVPTVRRRLQIEGALLAGSGGVLGMAGGVGYAWLLMAGLRTLWLPAVGSSALYLHVTMASLALGWSISVVVVIVSVTLAVRRLVRISPPALLAGTLRRPGRARPRRTAWLLSLAGLAAAFVCSTVALATGTVASPGLAFGTGASLLVSGLSGFAAWCGGDRRRPVQGGVGRIAALASRNSSWNPGRSVLSVSLMASACFVIVIVAANRGGSDHDLSLRTSGSGGFSLVAEADVPLHQDLGREEDRLDLAFTAADSARLERATFFPFRVLPGDDASCLNLYRPDRPRLLAATPEFVRRGGFTFQQHLELPAGETNPWTLLEAPHPPGVVPAIGDYNSVFWILHLGLGDELTLEDAFGRPMRVRIVGLLAESVFQSELVIAEADFFEHFPDRTGDGYFLIDAAGRPAEVSEILERTLSDFGLDVTTSRRRIAAFKVVQDTYLSTFQVLGALGLLLGTVGLGVVLIRNVIERRGELATLRAFGFRRALLARLVLAENAFLLLVGMSVGTLSALVAAGPRLAGQRLPWGSLSATLAVVVLAGMLSSVVALVATLRVPLLPALKADR